MRGPCRRCGSPIDQRNPGWSMGDIVQQVSWLAALSPRITFPDIHPVA